MCHAKVATHALFGRGAALDGDDRYGAPVFPANASHHSGVVAKVAVAVQLHKSIQAQRDHLACRGAICRAGLLDNLERGFWCGRALEQMSQLFAAAARMHNLVRCPQAGRVPFVQRQQLAYRERNLATRYNGIAKAVLQQKLGALESLGQALVHVLLDHARAGKCRQGIGLGQDNIALHGKARGYASGRGVSEHRDIQAARLAMAPNRRRDFGHLHERGHALLHAGATRYGKANDRQSQLGRTLKCAADLLAHHGTHRAHHKVGVHKEERRIATADFALAAHNGIALARTFAHALELVGIAGKRKEVLRRQTGIPFLKRALVNRHAHAVAPAHAKVFAATRADLEVVVQARLIDHTAALRALDKHVARGKLGARLGHRSLEDVDRLRFSIHQHRDAPSDRCDTCPTRTRRLPARRAEARCFRSRPQSRARPGPSASCEWRRHAWAHTR